MLPSVAISAQILMRRRWACLMSPRGKQQAQEAMQTAEITSKPDTAEITSKTGDTAEITSKPGSRSSKALEKAAKTKGQLGLASFASFAKASNASSASTPVIDIPDTAADSPPLEDVLRAQIAEAAAPLECTLKTQIAQATAALHAVAAPDLKQQQEDKGKLKELQAALAAGHMESTSPLYQKFGRWARKNESNKAELEQFLEKAKKAGKTANEAKANFRMVWANREIAAVTKGSSYTKQYEKIGKEFGDMKIFACLVEAMGFHYDPAGAVARAEKYLKS